LKAYLGKAFADGAAVDVEVLNFGSDADAAKICAAILAQRPDCVGYSCYVWNFERVLRIVREVGGRALAIQILGGPEISLSRVCSLPDPAVADYYVIGEGEQALGRLLQSLQQAGAKPLAATPGGVARWDGREIAWSGGAPPIADLDEIPSVYLSGALDDCFYARGQAFLETQRGCRFRCKYCVYHKQLPSVSYYSLERVFAELEHLIVEKQIMALRIFDAVFTSDLDRAKRIARRLLELKQTKRRRLPWIYWEFTFSTIDEEFLELAAALKHRPEIANSSALQPLDRPQLYSDMLADYCVINCVGVQSFNSRALRAVSRPGVVRDRFEGAMRLARKHNVVLKLDLILGLPFETFDSYFEGLEFCLPSFRETDHVLNVHRLRILPGSELEGLCDEYGIECAGDASHLVTSTSSFTREELNRAAKLTAVLFRVVNSPLRGQFFEVKERTGETTRRFAARALSAIESEGRFRDIPLVAAETVDDDYWNGALFSDLPSAWLAEFLAG